MLFHYYRFKNDGVIGKEEDKLIKKSNKLYR